MVLQVPRGPEVLQLALKSTKHTFDLMRHLEQMEFMACNIMQLRENDLDGF